MKYKYRAFGIPIYSEIELPALAPYNGSEEGIKVYARSVPVELSDPAASENPFTKYNSRELMYDLPEIGRYYVLDGAEIWVEPLSDDIKTVLLYFYSNCLAAVLLQRNLLVYHVSGVLDSQGKVVLIAGHSGAGKSTTATFLRSLGFTLFTDDTAILRVMDGKCYAKASYPMARLWEQTIAVQDVYTGDSKEVLRSKAEQYKYGFYFHDSFIEEEVEVSKILFLQEEGSEIVARDLSLTEGLTSLSANLYRAHWHKGMKKQKLVFQQLSQIINTVPVHQICRPKGKATFETFAQSIATNYL
jgi:energy-coupling factor transporter ATP-binding protein EcfA2